MNHPIRFSHLALVVALVLGAALVLTTSTLRAAPSGATINVTTNIDEFDRTGTGNGCSLREALDAADNDKAIGGCPAGNGDDTIVLQATTYKITRDSDPYGDAGPFWIATNVTINGAANGATILDGNASNVRRNVLEIGIGFQVTLNRLTIQNGVSNSFGGGLQIAPEANVTINDGVIRSNRTGGWGGGIYNEGYLRLNRTVVHNNQASGPGGGIYNAQFDDYPSPTLRLDHSSVINNTTDSQGGGIFSDGTVTLVNSTLDNNSAGANGGGLWNNGIATLRYSTISNNSAHAGGGGIESSHLLTAVNVTISRNRAGYLGGGLSNYSTAVLYSTTIASNTADTDFDNDGGGGGVYSPHSNHPIVMRNSLIADNTNLDSAFTGHADDCQGYLQLEHYNLVETTTDCSMHITALDNLFHSDPKLYPLADNGGPTKTQALHSNSPAIDAGNPNGCVDSNGKNLLWDQRGYVRNINGVGAGPARCDIGAFEYGSSPLPIQTVVVQTATPTRTPTNTPTKTPVPVSGNTATPPATNTPANAQCVTKPAAPALQSPANAGQLNKARVNLVWSGVSCATKYKVRVRLDNKHGLTVDKKKVTTTEYKTKALAKGHVYYWKVKACNALGCNGSGWYHFALN